jgi:hypothetical protein
VSSRKRERGGERGGEGEGGGGRRRETAWSSKTIEKRARSISFPVKPMIVNPLQLHSLYTRLRNIRNIGKESEILSLFCLFLVIEIKTYLVGLVT